MDKVLRDLIPRLSGDVYSYKRYSLRMDGAQITGAEAATHNTVPHCAIENGPMCLLYNTVRGEVLSDDTITFSFHALHDRLTVYMLVADATGQVHGSRLLNHDLCETVPLLFAD